MDIWEKRFKWLAEQHWVEGDAAENMDISYQCYDDYMSRLVKAVDVEIENEDG